MICVHFFWSCQSRWILKHNAVTPLPSCAPSTVNVLLNLSDAGVIPQWLQCYNKVGYSGYSVTIRYGGRKAEEVQFRAR